MRNYQDGIKEAIEICKRYLPQENLDAHLKVGYIMTELEGKLSETGGSVSCEAHRPTEINKAKKYDDDMEDYAGLLG